MKLLRIAAWTVWFMLSWTAFAVADPISGAIAAIVGIIKAGGIAATLIKMAIGLALQVGASLIQKALAGNRPQPGITGQLQVGGNNSFSFIVGYFATAGQLEYTGEWGQYEKTPNAYHVQVITLSDLMQGPLRDRIWINGQQYTIDYATAPDPEKGYRLVEMPRNVWVKLLDGTQTVADPYLLSKFGGLADKPWQADMIGTGLTVVVLTALVNRKLMTSLPVARYEPGALPLYDPRKDTTVGGSGAHRWGQKATYESTANPVVIIYNILRGIHLVDELYYGPRVGLGELPLDNWFAAMNECDIPIALEEGGSEPQYRCGFEIRTAEHEPHAVIAELLTACAGEMTEVGGIYKISVGAPALPVMFVTDEDFVVTEEQTSDPFKGLEQSFNGATASYPEPAAAWDMKDAPQRVFPDYVAADKGQERLAPMQYGAVPFPVQIQRLMTALVHTGRLERTHRGTLPPSAYLLESLDVVSWTSAREGYAAKHFQIRSMDDQPNVNQSVALRETDQTGFVWNPGTDELPHSVGPLIPSWPVPQPVTGWQVFPAEFRDAANNARRPSIEVRFDGDLTDIRAVIVRVRLAATGAAVFEAEIPYGNPETNPAVRSVILNAVLLPNTIYQVQGEFAPFSGRDMQPTAWFPVTTPNIRLGVDDIDYGDIENRLRALDDWANRGTREAIEEARRNVVQDWEAIAGSFFDRQTMRRDIVSESEAGRAYFLEQIDVATGPNSSIVQRLIAAEARLTVAESGISGLATSLSAVTQRVDVVDGQLVVVSQRLDDYGARILTAEGAIVSQASALSLLTTRVTDVEAEADLITQISALVGSNSSGGLLRIGARTTPAGAEASIALSVAASAGAAAKSAAMYLDAMTGSASRIAMVADQIVWTNGTTYARPMVFQGSTLVLDQLRVRWADIETIVAQNLVVTGAMIDTLTVRNVILIPGVATDDVSTTTVLTGQNAGAGWWTKMRLTITNPSVSRMPQIKLRFQLVANVGGNQTPSTSYFRLVRQGTTTPLSADSVFSGQTYQTKDIAVFTADEDAPAGTLVYELQFSNSLTQGSGDSGALNPTPAPKMRATFNKI